jgi:hypothetical protein
VPVDGPLDRRRLEPMPDDLDATWVDIGEPPIRLAWPDPGSARRSRSTRRRGS